MVVARSSKKAATAVAKQSDSFLLLFGGVRFVSDDGGFCDGIAVVALLLTTTWGNIHLASV